MTDVVSNAKDFQSAIMEFEKRLDDEESSVKGKALDDLCPVTHEYGDGCYIRTIFMPKGMLLTSKIHKVLHPYFVMKGKCTVFTENGKEEIEAPFRGMTKPGTKRLIHVLEDCIWSTVHVTKETELDKIEEEIIAKTFDECLPLQDEKEKLLCHGE